MSLNLMIALSINFKVKDFCGKELTEKKLNAFVQRNG